VRLASDFDADFLYRRFACHSTNLQLTTSRSLDLLLYKMAPSQVNKRVKVIPLKLYTMIKADTDSRESRFIDLLVKTLSAPLSQSSQLTFSFL
jgi:hypothetical protein